MTILRRAALLALALGTLWGACAVWRSWTRTLGREALLREEAHAALMAEVSRVFAEAAAEVEREQTRGVHQTC